MCIVVYTVNAYIYMYIVFPKIYYTATKYTLIIAYSLFI